METQPPSFGQISPEDWENTPARVKQLVESLLASSVISESESRVIQFLEATPIGIAIYDLTGQILYLNHIGRELVGIDSLSEITQDALSGVFQLYCQDSDVLYPVEGLPYSRALTGETVCVDDLEIHRPDRVIPLEISATPIFADSGQVIYAIAAFQDISDRKRREIERQILENTLRTSERHYRQIIQTQTDLILRSQPDTTITFANEAFCLAVAQSLEEVIGLKWSNFVPPEHTKELYRKIAALTPESPIFENINPDYRPNNQIGWTQWINLGIFDDSGQLIEIQSVGRDVTDLQEQIQREQALNRVFQSIRNSLDLDTIFGTATAETAQLLSPLDCFVVQYLPKQGIWRYIAQFRQASDSPTIVGFEIPDAENPFAESLQQFQVICVEDITTFPINPDISQRLPGGWLLIPLIIEENLWGTFMLTSSEHPFNWQTDQIELAQSVADQLEVAIQQANLYAQVQQELAERHRVEIALRESQARFQKMADNVPGVIFGYRLRPDGSDEYTYISSGFREMYGFEPDSALKDSRVVWNMTHPDDLEHLKQSVITSYQTLQTWQCVYRVILPSGELKWIQGISRPTQQSNGDVIWDGLIIDISERKQAEAALQESESRYRLLAENMKDLVCLHDVDGRYLYVSPSCESLLGYRYEEMLGQDPYTFFHPDDRDRIYQEARLALLNEKPIPITYRMRHKSGQYIWFETLTKPIMNQSGEVVQLQTTSRNVTERIRVQQQLEHDALHDSLTGLPNRTLLMERLELAIHRIKEAENYSFAVLFLDLDRFKIINDSLGHLAGDRLLILIAQKLQFILKDTDLAVRLGGDEFLILLEEIEGIEDAVRITQQIFEQLRSPLAIEGREVYTSASIGIVLGNDTYTQASDLLRDADIAMYRAKTQGKSRYEIFDTQMHIQAMNRLHLENDLRRAIEQQEFVLHYQPIIDLETQYLAGFEVLIRWQHPTQGLKFPGQFLAVAEETGLITHIDSWALYTACEQLAAWQAAFPNCCSLKVSVNLCASDLRRSDLLEEVDRVLLQTGLNGHCLTLEITESMLIDDIESTINLLSQFKERDIQISIDDFGTGYSSLSYLHRLPVNNLKVDRSFVNQMQESHRNHQIVETIIALSNQLELDAIAEGIETQEQLERLHALGYKFGQGYFFSKPLTSKDAEAILVREQ
ncbi:MAG: EAL domain-containing protein [Cyanobacteriota bacterium]